MIKCDYHTSDANITYYEFIDGFQYCNTKKKIPAIKKIERRAKNEILRRLNIVLSIDPSTIDFRSAIENIVKEESQND